VTRATRRFGSRVGDVAILGRPSLDFESPWPQLGRREPLTIAEISNDGTRRRRIDCHIVQRDHSADRHLPSLGSLSLERQPLHDARGVSQMAFAARLNGRSIIDREPACRVSPGVRRWSTATSSSPSAAATTLRAR
jgi:hypothetical protein